MDVFTVGINEPERKAKALVSAAGLDFDPELSPDGKWVAYHSNESGEFQVYVRPFPDVHGGRQQISTSGGTRATWSRNGRELFYLDKDGFLTRCRCCRRRRGVRRRPACEDSQLEVRPGSSFSVLTCARTTFALMVSAS